MPPHLFFPGGLPRRSSWMKIRSRNNDRSYFILSGSFFFLKKSRLFFRMPPRYQYYKKNFPGAGGECLFSKAFEIIFPVSDFPIALIKVHRTQLKNRWEASLFLRFFFAAGLGFWQGRGRGEGRPRIIYAHRQFRPTRQVSPGFFAVQSDSFLSLWGMHPGIDSSRRGTPGETDPGPRVVLVGAGWKERRIDWRCSLLLF